MAVPEFIAERALYRTSRTYLSMSAAITPSSRMIIPQVTRVCGWECASRCCFPEGCFPCDCVWRCRDIPDLPPQPPWPTRVWAF
jgi:hypothetical protein